MRRTAEAAVLEGWSSRASLPAHYVVFVGADGGLRIWINHLVWPGGPDHHRRVRLVYRVATNDFRDQAVESPWQTCRIRRNRGTAVKGIPGSIVVVQVNGDDVRVAPRVAVGSVRADAR